MQQLLKFVTENPTMAAAIGWPILSAIVNLLLKQHTVDEWIAFADKNPRLAALTRLFRAAGLDPTKTVQALVAFINGKAENLTVPSQPRAKSVPPPPAETPNA